MTVKEVFESVLIELDKVASPTMLLSDFNYFLNKATYQYLNKKYGVFEISQQSNDDLRTLKATAKLSILYKEGKYICFLDDDDFYLENYLEEINKTFESKCSG